MKNKIYLINDEIEKVAYATLKRVFSATVFPRILTNCKVGIEDFIEGRAFCKICLDKNYREMARLTHKKDFDIGIFFYKKDNKLLLKIIDGNGLTASDFTINIFDKFLLDEKLNFIYEKKLLDNTYKKLNTKKLLFEIVN